MFEVVEIFNKNASEKDKKEIVMDIYNLLKNDETKDKNGLNVIDNGYTTIEE